MRTFDDILATSSEIFAQIDQLMPQSPDPPAEKSAVRAPNQKRGTQPSDYSQSDAGKLDVGRYLDHYGVSYRVKSRGGKQVYVLAACLFDESHRGGDAAIVQHADGGLGYQCFHDSCQARSFPDARRIISGDDKIIQFYSGYDPEWRPPKKKRRTPPPSKKTPADHGDPPDPPAIDVCSTPLDIDDQVISQAVPHPDLVDPDAMFFEPTARSSRFVPQLAADYIANLLHPIVHTEGEFWRYAGGVWRPYHKDSIVQILCAALKHRASNATINGTIERVLPGKINRREDQWPDQGEHINVLNGMVSTADFTLSPHHPKYGSRVQLPVRYDPDAEAPTWDKSVMEMFEQTRDPRAAMEKYMLLQEFAGYLLHADCRFCRALILRGTGSNGKSVVIDVLTGMVGAANTSALSMHEIGERFKIGILHKKIVNFAGETSDRNPVSTDILKKAIAGDMLTAEPKYGAAFEFRPRCKFVFSLNEPPLITDKSYGFERRWLVIDFMRRFMDNEVDRTLAQRIIDTEIDGVFMWALQGLARLLSTGQFGQQETTLRSAKEFFGSLNPLYAFVEECIEVGDPDIYTATASEVYTAYTSWCRANGQQALSNTRFGPMILAHIPGSAKSRSKDPRVRRVMYTGFRLAAASASPDTQD